MILLFLAGAAATYLIPMIPQQSGAYGRRARSSNEIVQVENDPSSIVGISAEEEPYRAVVAQFLGQHPEFGSLSRLESLSPWLWGERRKVTTTEGPFIFYFNGDGLERGLGIVAGRDKKGEIVNLWESEDSSTQIVEEKTVPASGGLPAYVVIEQHNWYSKPAWGAFLITDGLDLGEATALETTLRAIMAREGAGQGDFYSTRIGYEADTDPRKFEDAEKLWRDGKIGSISADGSFRAIAR